MVMLLLHGAGCVEAHSFRRIVGKTKLRYSYPSQDRSWEGKNQCWMESRLS